MDGKNQEILITMALWGDIMEEVRVHNLLTFYLPLLILIGFIYGLFNKNSKPLLYVLGYLIAYLAIRLEIHHYTHKWGSHRDLEFVKTLVISELFIIGFLLPTVLAYSTITDFNKSLVVFFIVGAFIYVIILRIVDKISGHELLFVSSVLSLLILVTTKSILEPMIFALLSLWVYLVLKYDLVSSV